MEKVKSFTFNGEVITMVFYEKNIDKKVFNDINRIYKNYEPKSLDSNGIYLEMKSFLKSNSKYDDVQFDVSSSIATSKAIKYLKEKKIKKYIINENGNISAGKKYSKDKYIVSALDPKDGKLLKIIGLENESMVTLNELNDTYDSIIVISKDNVTANILAHYLYYLDIDSGKTLAQMYNCEAFWYYNNEVSMTDGFKKYII